MTDDRSDYQSMPTMHRRSFLGALIGLGVAAAIPLPVGVKASSVFLGDSVSSLNSGSLYFSYFAKKLSDDQLESLTIDKIPEWVGIKKEQIIETGSEDAGNGWTRKWFALTPDTEVNWPPNDKSWDSSIKTWGAQLEEGNLPGTNYLRNSK